MAAKKSTDLGAGLRGLILGGSVIFLLLLTIVWLTNRHFEGKKEAEATPAAGAPAAAPASGPVVTPGTTAPVTAPPAAPPGSP